MKTVVTLFTSLWLLCVTAHAASPPEAVLHAAYQGDFPTVKAWVDQHPNDVNAYGWDTRTLLHLSAGQGHLEIVDYLLKHGADPNLTGDSFSSSGSQQTALHVAAWFGQPLVVKRLLEAKADVAARDFGQQIPLHLGVLSKNEEVIRMLVKAGSNIHAPDRNQVSSYDQALQAGQTNLANLLLSEAPNPKTSNPQGNTTLHLAVLNGDVKTIEQLLQKNADAKATNASGLSPLHLALEHNRMDIVQVMTNRGATIDVFAAASLGRLEQVTQMLQAQPDLMEKTNAGGKTVLHWAAAAGQSALVTNLLDLKAQVDVKDLNKATPLDLAAMNGHSNVVEQLLAASAKPSLLFAAQGKDTGLVTRLISAGGDIKETNNYGETALHLAVKSGNAAMVQHLVTHGADVNARDSAGKTPLDRALRSRNTELSSALLKAGPKLTVEKKKPTAPTVLHTAISSHNLKVIPDLVKGGAELEARDAQDRTPLQLALENNSIEAMDILLKLGADIQATDSEGLSPLHLAVRYCFDWDDDETSPGIREEQPIWVKWGNRTGKYLLFKKADINATNKLGQTPFHMVGLRGEVGNRPSPYVNALVTNLVAYGGDINRRDAAGMTPLHLAVHQQSYPLVQALVAHGADPNIKNSVGQTALHLALEGTKLEPAAIPRTILSTGNTTKPMTLRRFPPSMIRPNMQIIQLLLDAKADQTVPDAKGKTPLQMAIELQDEEILQLLKAKAGK